jgi:hypothetical protein
MCPAHAGHSVGKIAREVLAGGHALRQRAYPLKIVFFYVLSRRPGQATDASPRRPYLWRCRAEKGAEMAGNGRKTGENWAKQVENCRKWAFFGVLARYCRLERLEPVRPARAGRNASPRRPRCAAAQRRKNCSGSFGGRPCLSATRVPPQNRFFLCPVPQAGTGHGRLGDAFRPRRTGSYLWR